MKVELDYRIPELPRPLEGNYQLDQDILKHFYDFGIPKFLTFGV